MTLAQALPICVSVFLPGCGHLAAGRPAKGLAIFFLFGFALDGFLYSQAMSILPPEQAGSAGTIRVLALFAGIGLWAYAIFDTVQLALRGRRIEARAEAANSHIREGLVAYLRDDYAAAIDALQVALKINGQDPDALFHIGVAYAHQGQQRKARRALNRCIRFDQDGKWDDEAYEQLRHLEATPAREPASTSDQGEEPARETQA